MPLYSTSPVITQSSANTALPLTNELSTTASKIANTNPDRKGLTIYNSLTVTLYIDGSNEVTSSHFMFALAPKAYYEMPSPLYVGEIWGILPSGSGSAQIRELT